MSDDTLKDMPVDDAAEQEQESGVLAERKQGSNN